MAFLDPQDVIERLYSLLPQGWFPDLEDAPNLQAVLSMIGSVYSNDDLTGLYQLLQYTQTQSRIHTATDFWLDMAAEDFFGAKLTRHNNETDDSFRRRIMLNLLAPRATRCALNANVQNLTGFTPEIIELRNTGDCGAYASLENPSWGGAAYNTCGHYGTLLMPYQLLINAYRPLGQGIPNVNGYSCSGGGYATYPKPYGYVGGLRPQNYGTGEYVLLSQIIDHVTDRDIYDTIAATMPVGTTAWTSIADTPEEMVSQTGDMLDVNFYLDLSTLSPDDLPVPGGAIALMAMAFHGKGHIKHGEGQALLQMEMHLHGSMYAGAPYTMSGDWKFALKAKGTGINQRSNLRLVMKVGGALQQGPTQPYLGSFIISQNKLGLFGKTSVGSVTALGRLGTFTIVKQLNPTLVGVSETSAVTAPTTSSQDYLNTKASISGIASQGQVSGVGVQGVESATLNLASVAATGQRGALTVNYSSNIQLSSNQITPLAGQLVTNKQTNVQMSQGVSSSVRSGTARTKQEFSFSGVSSYVASGTFGISANIQQNITGTLFAGTVIPIPGGALPLGQGTGGFILGQAGASTPLGQPATPQQWSASHKSGNIALSNANLTATATAPGYDTVYGKLAASVGKFYWEVVITAQQMQNITVGIGSLSAGVAPTQFVGSDQYGLGWLGSTGALMCLGQTLPTWPAYATGNTLCFALDMDNRRFWGRVGNGNWNGSALADPTTPSTGVVIPSTMTGAIAAGVTLNQSPDNAVAHFDQSSWTQTAPTGYSPWATATVAPPAPTSINITNVTSSGFTIDWTPSTVPTPPSNLHVTGVSGNSITFNWDPSS